MTRHAPSVAFGDSSPASGGAFAQILHRHAGEVDRVAGVRRRGGLVIGVLLGLALTACAGAPTRDGGVATLDALRDAQARCAARGGTVQLKTEGDPASIDDYACVRK